MKTITSGHKAKRHALRNKYIARSLAARLARSSQMATSSFSSSIVMRAVERIMGLFAQFACVERKGALVCCIPGAPIVRLPS